MSIKKRIKRTFRKKVLLMRLKPTTCFSYSYSLEIIMLLGVSILIGRPFSTNSFFS